MKSDSYMHWLKSAARIAAPMSHDFDGVSEAIWRICELLLVCLIRLLVLVTLPISAPVLALLLMSLQKRLIKKHEKKREEAIASLMSSAQRDEE